MPVTLGQQIVWLFVLAIPIACIARTVTAEEIFREPREWCQERSKTCESLFRRKFYYLFTCEYCFSHYMTIFFIALTNYHLLLMDWRGWIIAFFALVFVANGYLNLYGRLRVEIHREKAIIKNIEDGNAEALDSHISSMAKSLNR